MTATPRWDRAATAQPPIDGRRRPEIVALPTGLPTVASLFDFMRDAETRFATLRMRIEERRVSARGDETTTFEVALRHPGEAKVLVGGPGEGVTGEYEVWISDGEIVRTYAGAHKLGTQRPIRNRPRGLDGGDLPGFAQVYEPVTALPAETIPDTFVHPAGFCQNTLATGRCTVTGSDLVIGREALLLECDHPRTTLVAGDRPDYRLAIAIDRETGVILRLVESVGGSVTREAVVVDFLPDAPLQASAFQFVFPSGTTMLF